MLSTLFKMYVPTKSIICHIYFIELMLNEPIDLK